MTVTPGMDGCSSGVEIAWSPGWIGVNAGVDWRKSFRFGVEPGEGIQIAGIARDRNVIAMIGKSGQQRGSADGETLCRS